MSTIKTKHIYKLLTWLTKEKPFLLHIPACTWAQSTRQRSGCSINMGGLSSLCEREKRPQKSPRLFCNNSHEPKPPNLPVAAAQGIDKQPQFCSAEHVNLTGRESCSSVNMWCGYFHQPLQFQKWTLTFHTYTTIIQRTVQHVYGLTALCETMFDWPAKSRDRGRCMLTFSWETQ